jgi:hypothetical protein
MTCPKWLEKIVITCVIYNWKTIIYNLEKFNMQISCNDNK